MQRMIGAAAMLNPVFRIYEAGLKTKDVGIAATGDAKGSPLSPKGYSAEADIIVRGFDALPALLGNSPYAQYLPPSQGARDRVARTQMSNSTLPRHRRNGSRSMATMSASGS